MLDLTETEKTFASKCLDEFLPNGQVDQMRCVYRSHAFPKARQVLKVGTGTQSFALKIDRDAPATGRLRDEFAVLTDLFSYFAGTDSSQVVTPVYLSPSESFLVTEFIDRPTAVDLIHNSTNDDQVAQVFRRAGAWLNDLHARNAPVSYAFRPKWMTDSINQLLKNVPDHIAAQAEPIADILNADALNLKGIEDLRVFSHGDFHGQNLILGQGKTIGLDFTETRSKLAVYDIVDFLKSDIFRSGDAADVDRSGILKRNKDMFFRRYRHPIHMGILDFCLRARLAKDWLALWQNDHHCSAYEQDRRHRMEERLLIAFQC